MLWNTLVLMTPVVVLSILLAWPLLAPGWAGAAAGRIEEIGAVLALIPRALPVFAISAIVLLALFAYELRWFPIGGMRETSSFPETRYQELPFFDLARHLVLPVAAGVLASMADPR